VEIKINGNGNGYRLTAASAPTSAQQRKGDGDRVSDRRAFAREARGF